MEKNYTVSEYRNASTVVQYSIDDDIFDEIL